MLIKLSFSIKGHSRICLVTLRSLKCWSISLAIACLKKTLEIETSFYRSLSFLSFHSSIHAEPWPCTYGWQWDIYLALRCLCQSHSILLIYSMYSLFLLFSFAINWQDYLFLEILAVTSTFGHRFVFFSSNLFFFEFLHIF